jgi:hypothetical protein
MDKCKNRIRGDGSRPVQPVSSMAKRGSSTTSVVERQKGTSRLRNQRQVRKPLAFSKAPRYHRGMSERAVGRYNGCHTHSSLQLTQEAQGLQRGLAITAK